MNVQKAIEEQKFHSQRYADMLP